jgi:hypothetical protein
MNEQANQEHFAEVGRQFIDYVKEIVLIARECGGTAYSRREFGSGPNTVSVFIVKGDELINDVQDALHEKWKMLAFPDDSPQAN